MKKILSFMMIFTLIFCSITPVFAADEYSFDLQYTGNIIKNIEKDAVVILKGVNAPVHTNVQIKVEITGPATPKLLATDSTGVEHDIAQLGYWGPPSGFAVGGDFENKTPIKATFTEEGSYTIKLTLVDVTNSNAVITTRTFNLEVYEDVTPVNNVVENNIVEELPKTGTSIWEYAAYIVTLSIVLWGIGMYLNKRKIA
ncbi:MAG: hypothetical protein J6A04_06785 [Clostridia bacterium]|nr:hypothetical protein [Clostridia bacterium]